VLNSGIGRSSPPGKATSRLGLTVGSIRPRRAAPPPVQKTDAGWSIPGCCVALDPLRQFAVTDQPCVGKAVNVSQDSVELSRHQRPAAEMAMQRDVEVGQGLVGLEIVEGVPVDIVPVARIAAQHAMIGEIRMRQHHQHAFLGVDAERQVDVVVVAISPTCRRKQGEVEEAHRVARRANLPQPDGVDLTPKSLASSCASRPRKRGVSRSSRTLERDAMDALATLDEWR